MAHENFMNMANRNARAKELKAQGKTVHLSSIRGQLLHPQYVRDYPNPEIQADNGIGNAHYKTYFKVLYSVNYNESQD